MANASDLLFVYNWSSGSLTASAGSQQVVAANPERKMLSIQSDCPDPIFLRFRDGAASSSVFTVRIPAYQLYEVPKPMITESVHVAFGSASGTLRWFEES